MFLCCSLWCCYFGVIANIAIVFVVVVLLLPCCWFCYWWHSIIWLFLQERKTRKTLHSSSSSSMTGLSKQTTKQQQLDKPLVSPPKLPQRKINRGTFVNSTVGNCSAIIHLDVPDMACSEARHFWWSLAILCPDLWHKGSIYLICDDIFYVHGYVATTTCRL